MNRTLLLLVLFLSAVSADAQPAENFLPDQRFFEEQAREYQRWLDQSGLGATLRVHEVRVAEDEISLDLGFPSTNSDTVAVWWLALRRDFARQNEGRSLEEELFFKMVYFMQVPPTQGYVQVFNSFDTQKDLYTCFFRGIRYEQGQVKVDEQGCRVQIKEFDVRSTDIPASRTVTQSNFRKQYTKTAVFQIIETYVTQRFTRQNCDDRHPSIEWIDRRDELWFNVNDLCKEVLSDESNPWWCAALYGAGLDSYRNCIKRERLEFHIRYWETPEGFHIYCQLDAKFGSGFWDEVKRGAYKNMETDYKTYVEQYAQKFKNELFDAILR